MKPRIVLTAAFPRITREILDDVCDVEEHATMQARSEADVISLLREADGAITLLSDPVSRSVLQQCPRLRIVANFAVGYNNIDIGAARERGVIVTNTPGVLTEATADLTLALILAVTRRIVEGDREVRRTGRCEWEPLKLLGSSLQGKILGIIGMGRIGQAVALRARSFGMEVESVGRGESAEPLLRRADIVSLHAPLTAETRHLISRARLALMKRDAFLINTSRGPLVDEEALCDALERGQIRGAALDVFEHEPVVSRRLLGLPNVVLAPHIGPATEEARNAMGEIAATEIRRFITGSPPRHRVV